MQDLRARLTELEAHAELIDLKTPMKTVAAAAAQLGVSENCIFKSLVMRGEGRQTAVVVLPGSSRVDLKAVARVLGWKKARFADADLVLEETGYPAGGTPPIGHRKNLPVLVDEGLFSMEEGYGGGGKAELLLKITPTEIVRVTGALVTKLAKTE